MSRAVRIAAVTVGLAALGAITGAVAAYLAEVLSFLAVVGGERPWAMVARLLLSPTLVLLVCGQGAKVGVVLGPVVGWALLRRVPLGWAGVGLALGAFLGGLAGDRLVGALFHGTNTAGWFASMWGAAAGVLLAAAVLRVLFRAPPAARHVGEHADHPALPHASAPALPSAPAGLAELATAAADRRPTPR